MSKLVAVLAYNEVRSIGDVVRGARRFGDVLVVDDDSTDETIAEAVSAGATILRHKTNLGGGAGFRTVSALALHNNYEFLVTLDGDGEHDPRDLPSLLRVSPDADVVLGSRFLAGRPKMANYQGLGCRFYSKLASLLSGVSLSDVTSCYRVYRTTLLKEILPRLKENRYYGIEVLLKLLGVGARVVEVPIGYRRRQHGASKMGFFRFAWHLLRETWEAA